MANNATVIRQAQPNTGVKPGTVRKFADNSPAGTIPKSGESYATGQGGVMANCPMKSAAEVAKMGGAGAHMGHLGHFANDAVLNSGHNTGAHPGLKAAKKANPKLSRVKG